MTRNPNKLSSWFATEDTDDVRTCTCDDGDGDESESDLPLLDHAVPRLQLHQPHLDMVNIPGEGFDVWYS